MQDNINYTAPLNTVLYYSDAQASKIKQKCKDILILSNLDCSCRDPVEVRLVYRRVLSEYSIISECVEKKYTSDQISEYPFNSMLKLSSEKERLNVLASLINT